MTLISRIWLFLFCGVMISFQPSFAQEKTIGPKLVRKMRQDIPWPDVQFQVESAFESQAQFEKMSNRQKIDNAVAYCKDISRDYTAKAKNELGLKGLGNYFADTCMQLDFQLTGKILSYDQLSTVDFTIENLFDAAFSYIYNQPYLGFWKTGEDYFASYKASPFGAFGVPIKYSFLILQLLALLTLGFSIVAVLKRS